MASKAEIIDAIEALAVHCRPPLMSIDQRALWMTDWCNDLAQFPIDAIAGGCRSWRHSGETKFPTAGKLLPLIRGAMPSAPSERVEVWRELSDSEYANLTVREKIRHRTILAHEARLKAGPMYRNTTNMTKPRDGSLSAEEMPGTWRHWSQIAEGHEAEAKRLREVLRRPMQAAAE